MNPVNINNANHLLGQPKRYDEKRHGPCGSLAVRVENYTTQSAWLPTKEELELLNKGYAVKLTVLGLNMPPVMLEVTDEFTPRKVTL